MQTVEGKRFPFLSRLARTLLTLPFSTAEIERLFSSLKLTKTPIRGRPGDKTLTNILTIKESLKRKTINIDTMEKEDLKCLKKKIITDTNKKNENEVVHINLAWKCNYI